MSTILPNLLAILAVVGVASVAPAAVLWTETFSYSNGPLASYGHPEDGVSGGLWTAGFGIFPVNVSDGKVTLTQLRPPHQTAFSGEDVKRQFSALAAGQTICAGFDISASGGSARVEFARVGRGLYITPSLSGGDFTFGIGRLSSSPSVSWPSGLSFNTTYRTILSYEFDTGISRLWVNPVNQFSPSVSFTSVASEPVFELALFQSFTGESPTPASAQVLDNIVIGTSFDDVLAVPGPTLPGDYNSDGTVDAADYVVWRKNIGTQDGYNVWRAHFGQMASSGSALSSAGLQSAAVPEPASLVLVGIGLAAAGAMTLRRHQSPRK